MTPKLKWQPTSSVRNHQMWEVNFGRVNLCIGELVDRGKLHLEASWIAPAGKLIILVNEPSDCTDVVDAMARCEQRARDVLTAEFGELLK